MGFRDRLRGRSRAESPPVEKHPDGVPDPEQDPVVLKVHMDRMLANGSMSEREYRQEWQRLFGEEAP